jgi:hypothetical protein
MAFSTVDSIIAALTAGNGNRYPFTKTLPSTTVAGVPHTCWAATGMPGAGGNTTTGKANGAVCTTSTAGSMPYVNASSGQMSFLTGNAGTTASAGAGTLIFYDRIAHCNIAHNEASGSFSGMTGSGVTGRLGSTEGAQIWLEVTTAFSAATNTLNFGYTNQAGTSGQTTPNFTTVASSIVGRNPVANTLWLPLATGDTGVRSLDSITLVSGTATGNMNVVLARPLVYVPIITAAEMVARDTVTEMYQMPNMYNSTCLSFIFVPNAAGTPTFFGEYNSAFG